eukprot:PITA_16732
MVEEYKFIMTNDVWEVVPRPEDRSVIGSRWIYKIKYVADGSIEKNKARFMAKGYAQKEGINYEETFTLVARYTSVKPVISLAAQMGWEIHQMDVKTIFLDRVIEEEVYIDQPKGFKTHEKRTHVCRLRKSCMGSSRHPEHGMVDDLLLTGSSRLIKHFKKNLEAEFNVKDMGLMHYFLGLDVWQKNGESFLGQGRYSTEIQNARLTTHGYTHDHQLEENRCIGRDKEVDPTLYR